MTTIRAFKTESGYAIEDGIDFIEFLKEHGFKPQTSRGPRGVGIATGVTDIEKLKELLGEFHGENNGLILRVFSEGSSKDFQDFQL